MPGSRQCLCRYFDGGESGILSSPLLQTLCIQQNATNRSPYRHLGSITSGTVVTEKTLINPNRPDCSMDGMDSVSPSRHKPPPVSTQIRHDPLAVSCSQAQRALFRHLIPEPMHVTAVKERAVHDFKGLTRGGRPLSRWKFCA